MSIKTSLSRGPISGLRVVLLAQSPLARAGSDTTGADG
ncbi:MAG: hypothetical protein RLZZ22_196 [Pseudomonadota bacterium]|jgi:hypothetical protein